MASVRSRRVAAVMHAGNRLIANWTARSPPKWSKCSLSPLESLTTRNAGSLWGPAGVLESPARTEYPLQVKGSLARRFDSIRSRREPKTSASAIPGGSPPVRLMRSSVPMNPAHASRSRVNAQRRLQRTAIAPFARQSGVPSRRLLQRQAPSGINAPIARLMMRAAWPAQH